jgi:hypothetical protein
VSEIHIKVVYGSHKPFLFNLVKWIFKCICQSGQTAVRTLVILAVLTLANFSAQATTLLRLGLGDMAQDSTAIARVKIVAASDVLRGSDVFTVYRFETLESLKKPASGTLQNVAVPGGAAGGIRQIVAGAPVLHVGSEYVLFLWTSRSGLTQIVGLSQGLFEVNRESSNRLQVRRAATSEQMLDAAGRPVRPEPVTMSWSEMKSLVSQAINRPLAAVGSK